MLIDCQGSDDTAQATPTLDNAIMFLGLQLSDMHILNTKGRQKAGDLERMEVQ